MSDQRVYLKVKIKSLTAESRIIRKEEKKNSRFHNGLAEHRKGTVRRESRLTHLAYGFIRGRKYEQIEQSAREKPDWKRVREMVKKYGSCWEDETYKEYQERKAQQLEAFEVWIEVIQDEK